MNKIQFLASLTQYLDRLPPAEAEEHLNFYREMIEDRIEDGLSEEEAVADVGDVEQIAAQILQDVPPQNFIPEKPRAKKKWKTWQIVLLALGSPVWFPLLIAALSVILALYLSWWTVVISLWSVFASLAASALAAVVAGVFFACTGHVLPGLATIAAGMVCAGLAIFLFYGCKVLTAGTVRVTKKLCTLAKRRHGAKEESV